MDDATGRAPAQPPTVARAAHAATGPVRGRDPVVSDLVLPCYNERDHVLAELRADHRARWTPPGCTYEVLAIDDASTDGTLAVLREAAATMPHLQVLAVPPQRRFRHRAPDRHPAGPRRDRGVDRRRHDLPERADPASWSSMLLDDPSYDQVVGARTTEEGTHKWLRVPAKWFIRKIAERLTNQRIPDLNSGLRAFRREVALPYLRAAAGRVLLRHDDHPGVPVATSTTSATCRSTTPSGPGSSKFHFVTRRLPLHPPGAAHGHVLRPAQGAHAAGAVAGGARAWSRPSSTWSGTRSTSRPTRCCW